MTKYCYRTFLFLSSNISPENLGSKTSEIEKEIRNIYQSEIKDSNGVKELSVKSLGLTNLNSIKKKCGTGYFFFIDFSFIDLKNREYGKKIATVNEQIKYFLQNNKFVISFEIVRTSNPINKVNFNN